MRIGSAALCIARSARSAIPWGLVFAVACAGSSGTPVSDPYDDVCPLECHGGLKCGIEFGKTPLGTTGADFACMPAGNVGPGGDCTVHDAGGDSCLVGSVCTGVAVPDDQPNSRAEHTECRSFCKDDSDCQTTGAGTLRCMGFAGNFSWADSSFVGGICVETCTPFSDECGAKGTCAAVVLDSDGKMSFTTCHFAGSGTADSTCTTHTDCGADSDCIEQQPLLPQNPFQTPAGACKPLCDTTHACSAFLCREIGSGIGFCP
jgi:hypothetical protein